MCETEAAGAAKEHLDRGRRGCSLESFAMMEREEVFDFPVFDAVH